jgi:AcrR family transcriptional regulator
MSASLTPVIRQRQLPHSSRSEGARTAASRGAAARKTKARKSSAPGRAVREDIRGADSTRKKLIEVAGRVFAEHGYYAATVRDICAQAGSNVAAVNYHFRDKLGLYTEVLQQSVRASNVYVMQDALDQDAPPEKILRDVIRARLSGVCRGDAADQKLRILLHELTQPTPAIDRILREITQPIYERMLELAGELIGLPAHDETTRLCAHSIMGQIMLYALGGALFGLVWQGFKMTPQRTERIAEHIADFSMAYLNEVAAKHRRNGAGHSLTKALTKARVSAKSQAKLQTGRGK